MWSWVPRTVGTGPPLKERSGEWCEYKLAGADADTVRAWEEAGVK